MERRYSLPGGPRDVISGFVSLVSAGAILLLVLFCGIKAVPSLIYVFLKMGGVKVVALFAVGFTTMLYRERVMLDPFEERVVARRYWFLFPVTSGSFPFRDVTSIRWEFESSKSKLVLSVLGNHHFTLAKSKEPDEGLARELRDMVGLG